MSTPYGSDRRPGPEGEQEEPIRFTDRRRIDPLTGEVRTTPPFSEPGTQQGAGAPGATPPVDPEPEIELEDPRIADLEKQLEERTNDLQRVQAEYANYRRRVDRDREATLVSAKVSFVNDLLTVLDDIARAEQHGDLTGPFKSVADKVAGVVNGLGLESFGKDGEIFDPALHEAVQHEPAEAPGPTVTILTAVLRQGYTIAGRVLRPAMVTVADRPDPTAENTAPTTEA